MMWRIVPESYRSVFRAFACLSVVCALVGCDLIRKPGSQELDDSEVVLPLDVNLSTEEDPKAVQRAPQVSGVLPSDFPSDLPLYKPSSVVDFGETRGGRYSVLLFTPDSETRVQDFYATEMRRAGWSRAADGLYSKAGREIRLDVSGTRGGVEIRVEY